MTGRVARGFALMKASWNVLKLDKELMLLPILSLVVTLLILASFAAPFLLAPGLQCDLFGSDGPGRAIEGGSCIWVDLGLFLFYVASYLVVIFFNTALVACAVVRFQGGDPTLRDGLRAAWARLPQIASWAIVAATVGFILKMIEERVQLIGKLVARFIGLTWTVATFFVVPVLAVERLGPTAAVRRSVELLRTNWGESLVGQVSLSAVTFLLALPGILLIMLGIVAVSAADSLWPASLLGVGLVYVIALAIATSTMQQIFLAGAYLFAAQGKVPEGFSEEVLRAAFRKKST
jgi:hypothetical protein